MKRMFILPFVAAVLMVLFSGCKKEEPLKVSKTFGARIEPPAGEDKTYLVNEKWIYWDEDDKISVLGTKDPAGLIEGKIVSGANSVLGYFQADGLVEGSSDWVFLFPHSSNNYIDLERRLVKIWFPASQPFRDDLTFGKESCPMVGWVGDKEEDSVLFHSVAGLARIQLFSSVGDKTISNISFTEVSDSPKQIAGLFNVGDYDQFDPYLTGTSPANRQIDIPCGAGRVVGNGSGSLCTFYLVLPAYAGTTTYKLQMTVTASDSRKCVKTFAVKVRRNSIMKVPALDINDWENGNATVSIVGNGTELRPFQIYTAAELAKVRDAINSGGKINGQTITSSTQFALMRSDIELNTSNWTSGIKNFKGHFYYAGASSVTSPGITNNSNLPIFASISDQGVVEDFTIKGTREIITAVATRTSPFCGRNNGTIKNCRTSVTSSFTLTASAAGVAVSGIAGICDSNAGTIIGCSHQGTLLAPNHTVAGICLYNLSTGKIVDCYTVSTGKLNGEEIGGLVYRNEGLIRSSYYGANTSDLTGRFGGIAYHNKSNIRNCMVQSSAQIISSKAVGGIVHINYEGALIDTCSFTGIVLKGNDSVGGIVCSLRGGDIRNTYMTGRQCMMQNGLVGYMGGFVAIMHDGSVKNCYARTSISGSSIKGGFCGKIVKGTIENVYARVTAVQGAPFYGQKESAAVLSSAYNYKVEQAGVRKYDSGTAPIGDYASLYAALQAWVDANGAPYKSWTAGENPTL